MQNFESTKSEHESFLENVNLKDLESKETVKTQSGFADKYKTEDPFDPRLTNLRKMLNVKDTTFSFGEVPFEQIDYERLYRHKMNVFPNKSI